MVAADFDSYDGVRKQRSPQPHVAGLAYEELARLTGDKPREVNFYLPASNIPILRQVPGYEPFDPAKELLHCDKLGTGLVDAPRAFSLKLSMVTKERCGLSSRAKLTPSSASNMKMASWFAS